jgi:hypothetical protein
MTKAFGALTTVLVIILLIETMTTIDFVQANLIHAPSIQITSPEFSSNKLYYNTTTIPLSIEVDYLSLVSESPLVTSPEIANISYSLDGQANVTLTNFHIFQIFSYSLVASSTLNDLKEGNHTLIAYAFFVNGGVLSATRSFLVDTTPPYPTPKPTVNPTLSIISPQNQTYSTNEIPLTYSISGKIMWSNYKLDEDNSPDTRPKTKLFTGNITLTHLSEGPHKIQINVATDVGGSDSEHIYLGSYSKDIYFNVDTSRSNQPSVKPNIEVTAYLAIGIIVIIVCSVLAIIIYRKRKLSSKQSFL